MHNPTVVFPAPKQVSIEDRDVPAPEEGQALVRSELTLISTGTELTVLGYGDDVGDSWSRLRNYPLSPGYCNVGLIEDVGPGVDRESIGRRVQSYGGHGRYVLVPMELARPVPDAVASDVAVFATMAEIALNGVRRTGIGLGWSVVVCGLGLLGQLAARFARLCGARPVIAVDLADSRLSLLPDDAAIVAVNAQRDDIKSAVQEATRNRMADVVLELTGAGGLIADQIELLREQGTLGVVSGPRGQTHLDLLDSCVTPSVTIMGIHNMSHPKVATLANPWTKNRDVELYFDLAADGDIDVTPLITHREAFSAAPELYRMLAEDRTRALGVLLDWAE